MPLDIDFVSNFLGSDHNMGLFFMHMNNGTKPLKGEGIMGRMRTAFNAAMAAIVAAFMVIMSIQAYKELFVRETEPPVKQRTGIINVWHVVKYKPYSGSVSTIMADAARKLEKRNTECFTAWKE